MFLPLPDDFHAHLRQGELMNGYVRDLVSQFGRAIIMPNTVPAMTSAKAIADYKKQILEAAAPVRPDFEPLMTFKLNPNYTEQDLKDMMDVGVVAGKYYPAGVTTNSADGISDFKKFFYKNFSTDRGNHFRVWCNGLDFDFPILKEFFRRFGFGFPWMFWTQYDYRTIKNCFYGIKDAEGNVAAHNALEDAKAQMRGLRRFYEIMDGKF